MTRENERDCRKILMLNFLMIMASEMYRYYLYSTEVYKK